MKMTFTAWRKVSLISQLVNLPILIFCWEDTSSFYRVLIFLYFLLMSLPDIVDLVKHGAKEEAEQDAEPEPAQKNSSDPPAEKVEYFWFRGPALQRLKECAHMAEMGEGELLASSLQLYSIAKSRVVANGERLVMLDKNDSISVNFKL